MKKLLSLLVLTALYTTVIAQAGRAFVINGKVTSFEESLPLEGASVVVKGSSNATGTQADGTFSLSLGPGDSVLIISLAGYAPKEIKTSARSRQYDIVLQRNDKAFASTILFKQIARDPWSKQTSDNYLPPALISGDR